MVGLEFDSTAQAPQQHTRLPKATKGAGVMQRWTEQGHPGAPPQLDETLGTLNCESKLVFKRLGLQLFQREGKSRELPPPTDLVRPTASLTRMAATISHQLWMMCLKLPSSQAALNNYRGLLKVKAIRNAACSKPFSGFQPSLG